MHVEFMTPLERDISVQVGFWLAWLATQCTDATALEAAPLSLLGVAPGAVYLYQAAIGAFNKKCCI
jgi:hypothetical protein